MYFEWRDSTIRDGPISLSGTVGWDGLSAMLLWELWRGHQW